MEKYGRIGQATDNNITQRMRFACWLKKALQGRFVGLQFSYLECRFEGSRFFLS
jgi:hypothetical protein